MLDGQLRPLPSDTTSWFWHDGTLFSIGKHSLKNRGNHTDSGVQPDDFLPHRIDATGQLTVRCFGWSDDPVKKLIEEVNKQAVRGQKLNIIEMQAGAPDKNQQRKKLPCSMIDLDPNMMDDIIADVDDFFHRDSQDWYESTGRRYRRGYLFCGPPGTGKTSLSSALASHCNVPLVIIHMRDMGDNQLKEAFDRVPFKSVVLLEDIDCAGADVSQRGGQAGYRGAQYMGEEADDAHMPGTRNNDKVSSDTPNATSSSVSLSGLLNVIDGANAKEGRLLIMTTNRPEKLDPSLYRAGRIDRTFKLGYANKQSALRTFKRLFANDAVRRYTADAIDRFAKAFQDQFPSRSKVTTAELSKYCGQYRGRPDKAVEEFADWLKVGVDMFTCPVGYTQSNEEEGEYNVPEPFDRALLQVGPGDLVDRANTAERVVTPEVYGSRAMGDMVGWDRGIVGTDFALLREELLVTTGEFADQEQPSLFEGYVQAQGARGESRLVTECSSRRGGHRLASLSSFFAGSVTAPCRLAHVFGTFRGLL